MTQWNIAFKKLGHVYYYVTLAIGVEYSDIRVGGTLTLI